MVFQPHHSQDSPIPHQPPQSTLLLHLIHANHHLHNPYFPLHGHHLICVALNNPPPPSMAAAKPASAPLLTLTVLLATSSLNTQVTPVIQSRSCGDVDRVLTPCIPYLVGRTLRPSILCCIGASSVKKMAAASDQDRQAVCECLKGLGSQFVGLDPFHAARLPGLCGIRLSVPISATVNCSNIPPIHLK